MTELSALNVRITGNADGLEAALQGAAGDLRQFQTQVTRTTAGAATMGTGIARMGQAFSNNRAAIQNVSYQLQDFVVQVSAGTRASTAMAMQLPQLASGFGAVGAVVGTLAAVGIPLLAAAFFDAGNKAGTLQDALDALSEVQDGLKATGDILRMSVGELTERYGVYAASVRDAALALAELQVAEARQSLREQTALVASLAQEYDRMDNRRGNAYRAIEQDFNVTRDQARELLVILEQMSDATTFEQQQAAVQAIGEYLEQNNIALDEIPASLQAALAEMLRLQIATAETAAEADRLSGILASLGDAETGPTGGGNRRGGGGQGITGPRRPVRGGGGGRGARTNPLVAQLEQLRQSLMSQTELELENYQTRQEMLQQALEQRLLTQQEYAALMESEQARHADRMAELDVWRYGSTLDRAESFLGSMAQAFASGNEDMLRVSKAFGAAQALISAWQGAAEALKLPFPQNLAAFAQVLSTGLGAVQAIKSVGKGGTGGGGAGAAAGGGAGGMGQNIYLNIQPNARGDIPMDTFRGFIDTLNDQLSRGGVIVQ